jgi:hypothetical protein
MNRFQGRKRLGASVVAPFLKPPSNGDVPIYEMKSFINGTFEHFPQSDHLGFVTTTAKDMHGETNLSVPLPLNVVACVYPCSNMDVETRAQSF